MSKFLFVVWPFPTHLHPHLAVARALAQRGHRVAFYTGQEAAPAVVSEGLEFYPFVRVDWSNVQRTVGHLIAEHGRPRPALWRRFLVDTIPDQVADLETLCRRWQPDLLVCDVAMWGPILILHERDRIPVVVFSHVSTCLLPGPDGPVAGVPLPRARNRWTRLRSRLISALVSIIGHRVPREGNRLRRAYGLAPISGTVNKHAGTMPLYLVPSVPELDNHRRDLPASVHYVGACPWTDSRLNPPGWTRLAAGGESMVLVEEGALYTPAATLLEAAARGLAGQSLPVTILAGEGRPPGAVKIERAASNLQLRPWCPLSFLLPRTRVMVTNGNSESVLAALTAGVPLVVNPSLWDQGEMANLVEQSGVGLRIRHGRRLDERISRAVSRVLNHSRFADRAAWMATRLALAGGADRAARLIEGLLDQARMR